MTDLLDLDFSETPTQLPAGVPGRFTARWRLVGAGLSNVWRFGDLDLNAPTGRLLLRGQNGTGKTTALEALWPYLLDLDAARLAAGKARSTTLKQLMAEGAPERGRRYGYVWLTFASPAVADEPHRVSYGVRLQYSPTASPAVVAVPFTAPGRPLAELALTGTNGAALEHDEFRRRVEELGGEVFDAPEVYLEHLAARMWNTSPRELKDLAQRMRQVRNPALLGDVSPAGAAEALRRSLPRVADDEIAVTAEALAESESTRQAFERDRNAAETLRDFLRVWTGHIVETSKTALKVALTTAEEVQRLRGALARLENDARTAAQRAEESARYTADLENRHRVKDDEVRAIEQSDAYRTAGSVKDLQARLASEHRAAVIAGRSLAREAAAAVSITSAARNALDSAVEQLAVLLSNAAEVGATAPPRETLLAYHHRARQTRRAGDIIADPGPGFNIHHNGAGLDGLGQDWSVRAASHQAEAGTAAMLLTDFMTVADAARARSKAAEALEVAETQLSQDRQLMAASAAQANQAATALLNATSAWADIHPQLRAIDPVNANAGYEWDSDDLTELRSAEPAAVLNTVASWAGHAAGNAERLAAAHDLVATACTDHASSLDTEAVDLHEQARWLRSGTLLPLPRPDWAGEGDDLAALGSILEWNPDVQTAERDRIEFALAASGVLGAHLDSSAAHLEVLTDVWTVASAGPQTSGTLAQVLNVDPDHPRAADARMVLASIGLADTAPNTADTGLVIGRDGTYSSGPIRALPVRAQLNAGRSLPEAQHVGARTRQDRARKEAERLETAANELVSEAVQERAVARAERDAAKAARTAGGTFPARHELQSSEAQRGFAAQRMAQAQTHRDAAQVKAGLAADAHQGLHSEWTARALNLRMPTEPEQLTSFAEDHRRRARRLIGCATGLRKLTATTLLQTLNNLPNDELIEHQLSESESEARDAHSTARTTQSLLDEIRRDPDAEGAVRRHRQASDARSALLVQLKPAREAERRSADAAVHADAIVQPAQQGLNSALPAETDSRQQLGALFSYPPVASALGIADFLTEAGRDPDGGLGEGSELVDNAIDLLSRKPTSGRRSVLEKYETTRAELAQTWTLGLADPPEGIDILMFILTHAEDSYDPPRAAARAAMLSARAEAALADAEADAIERFVIGRLPSAIGIAWTKMQDWKREVNAKMRSAQASSGVGVQVRITLRDDLDAWTQAVHRLSTEVGDATRTEAQKRQVGDAIAALLSAADGDTMAERLANAIDITSWVDVKYLVERPGQAPRAWGSRTTLSGGERRLVVLAPMLAAIAANYDRLGSDGLRLVPLDEVPAEVDEQGREGLARYMAELDLDLLCTSYLWDGAPGAWDGIDAWDLESGSDGTVVAFPMLVRGLRLIPEDITNLSVETT